MYAAYKAAVSTLRAPKKKKGRGTWNWNCSTLEVYRGGGSRVEAVEGFCRDIVQFV